MRRRPPGRPSTSSSLLPEHTGETSEGPATGPSRAGPGLTDTSVSECGARLGDPAISEAERFHIRETVRFLAYRPALPVEPGTRTG